MVRAQDRLDAPARSLAASVRRLRPETVGLLAIVVAQAVWVTILCQRGWYYTDDFAYLAQAKEHALGWGYLTLPSGDHLAPGLWLVFWFFVRGAVLHYGVGTAIRVILQAVATILLYRLLVTVSGSRRGPLVILALYAASPLLVPGTLWLTNSFELLPGQICAIVAYQAQIRRWRGGSLRDSVIVGVALFVGMCFWEKTGVTAVLLVVLTAGWLTTGGPSARVGALLRDWRGWLCAFVPSAVFTAYFIAKGYGSKAKSLPLGAAVHLDWLQWSHSVWPAVIGAPWRWFALNGVYTAIAAPGQLAVVLGQVAFVALLVVAWCRRRWSGVFAWLLPILSVGIGEVLVALGRYSEFGTVPAVAFNYAFDVAVPLALAAALSFWRLDLGEAPRPKGAAGREDPEPDPESGLRPAPASASASASRIRRRGGQLAIGLLVPAVVVSSVFTSLRWDNRWHTSPAKAYTTTLVSRLHRLGPNTVLYNSPVAEPVLPLIEPVHHLSDLLDAANVKVHFDAGPTAPLVVDPSGRPVPARFLDVATSRRATNGGCVATVAGAATVTVRLRPHVGLDEYFLKLSYRQPSASTIVVEVRSSAGTVIPPFGPGVITLGPRSGDVLAPLGYGSPGTVRLTEQDPGATLCLTSVAVGVPVPAGR